MLPVMQALIVKLQFLCLLGRFRCCGVPLQPMASSLQAVGFEQAVAAVVQHVKSQPYQSTNQSLLVRYRVFMPGSLAHALKELGSGEAPVGVLHLLADAAFLFSSFRPVVLAFLEEKLPIVECVKRAPHTELAEVVRSVVLLNSLRCLPPQAMLSLLVHPVTSVRWMAVSCMARELRLSAPEVHAFTQRALPDADARFECECSLQQRQRHLQVC